jgi:EpsI family protein
VVARAAVLVALIAAAGGFTSRAASVEAPVARAPLADFPRQLDAWTGSPDAPFEDDVVAQLGVDEYINRRYVRAGAVPVSLYVGYYASQRQGDTIHSPQNCLPGAGWQPVESGDAVLTSGGRDVRVNRYVIQKGIDRQIVLYWYQGRGRTVANEYANKLLLMFDAARLHRTNGGLIRVMAPVLTDASRTTADVHAFASALLPSLPGYLP